MIPIVYKTKKLFPAFLFICIAMLVLVLAACGAPTTKPSIDLITPGTLTVGSDAGYPPQEYLDTNTHQYVGFDVDVIKAIAQRMGLQTTIVNAKFASIIDSLSAKRFDVVISAMGINSDRQKKVDFVPYFKAGTSLLVQQGNPQHIKSTADLCGQGVGVENGTIEQSGLQTASDACKKAGKPAITITVLQDQTAVIQLLATNRVVATYQDSPVTAYYNKLNPGRFEVGGSVVDAVTEGIAIRKGDTSMFNAVQSAFDALKADGTYHKIVQQWGLATGELAIADRRNY